MQEIKTLTEACEYVNNKLDLDMIKSILLLGNHDTFWEYEMNDTYSLIWNSAWQKFYLSEYDSEKGENQYELELSNDINYWYMPEFPFNTSSSKAPVEIYLSNLARKLRSCDPYINKDGYWEIDTGDEGWMSFVNGQYVVGAYGTITPDSTMNKLMSHQVTNLNVKRYSSSTKNKPFIQKGETNGKI